MLNLNGKKFCSIENSGNGEVSGETIFNYFQDGKIVWADYSGGSIIKGNLIALMDDNGRLTMNYHHINKKYEIMTGECKSIPEKLPDGRIRFHEEWKWTVGDFSSGNSIVEEIG